MPPLLAELPARSNTPFAPISTNPSEPTMLVARRYSSVIIPELQICKKLPKPTDKSPAAAQQHVTDTEMQAVRAVRASNETRSCPARNGVAMGDQWVDREPR